MADAKKKPSPKSKGKSKGASRSNRSAAFVAFLKSERFAHIRGAVYVLFSIFLVISLAGYYATDCGSRGHWLGTLGQGLAEFFAVRLFGIGSLGFGLLFFVYGMRLWRVQVMPWWKTFGSTLFWMLWLSLMLGYSGGAWVQSASGFEHFAGIGLRLAEPLHELMSWWTIVLLLFVAVLFLVFECTFTLGAYPQDWIQLGIDSLCGWLSGVLPSGWLSSMMVDGVVQGVGAVLAFLPNIVILFFFLSILEDVGYMARAAYLMDGIMHLVGLHGRSFIPMLMGFGCNVPAIMAARDIQNRKDRTLTMLMIPFMSCSARLPVYLLLVSAFFPSYKALVMISLYVAGVVLSILFALLMKHTPWFRKDRGEDYVSELPAFRRPTVRNTGMHIWERCADYLKKISTVILLASVIIWVLSYFPRPSSISSESSLSRESTTSLDHSYLARIGQWMDPVMSPLGFDWKMNVCILTGLPAKEAIVSTMAILYNDSEKSENSEYSENSENSENSDEELALATTLRERQVFTPASAMGFMMFVLLYFPCVATIATLRREIGRGWAAFSVVNSIALAWLVAFLIHLLA